jgi:phosphate transport system permease protein
MSVGVPPAPLTLADLRGSPGRRRRESIVRGLFFAAAALAVVISVLIVLSLLGQALTFLSQADLATLIEPAWQPRQNVFGVGTLIAGTLVISAIAMLVATPLGLGAAVFLAEYANPRVRRVVKPIIEVLAAIPSVVLGFFALTVLSPNLIDPICPGPTPLFTMALSRASWQR